MGLPTRIIIFQVGARRVDIVQQTEMENSSMTSSSSASEDEGDGSRPHSYSRKTPRHKGSGSSSGHKPDRGRQRERMSSSRSRSISSFSRSRSRSRDEHSSSRSSRKGGSSSGRRNGNCVTKVPESDRSSRRKLDQDLAAADRRLGRRQFNPRDEDEDDDEEEVDNSGQGGQGTLQLGGGGSSGKSVAQLEKENEELHNTVIELQQNRSGGLDGGCARLAGSGGKNKTRRKLIWTGMDKLNWMNLSLWLKRTVHPHVKMLPKGWETYSEDQANSICARVMGFCGNTELVTCPYQYKTKKEYWTVVCSMINEKWCALRSNCREDLKRLYQCEFGK